MTPSKPTKPSKKIAALFAKKLTAKALARFKKTSQVPVIALHARVMEKPQFFGPSLTTLRRGALITVLDLKVSWFVVRTKDGKQGWMHKNRLLPRFIRLRSGDTGSGSARGELELGGRG